MKENTKRYTDHSEEPSGSSLFDENMLESKDLLAIFNSLSRNFRNVYLANINTGTARILKVADDYDLKEVVDLKNRVFAYESVLENWIAKRVHPDDREQLMKSLCVENLRKVFSEQDEYVGNYRSIDCGKLCNYQFNLSKIDDLGTVVAGFQIIDSIIEEHLAQERKQREKEEAHRRELERSYRKLEEMRDILATSKMGTWCIRLLDGKPPTMEADELMRELLGISGQDISPEEIYQAWFSNIDPDSLQSVLDSVESMKQGNNDENTYLWKHPVLGERYVRCGGTSYKVPEGFILRGYHYDVDEQIRRQKKQAKMLQDTRKAEKQHAEVISTLATIYTTILLAKLDTHTYQVLSSVELMEETAGKCGKFEDVKEKVLAAFIAPDMQEEMREFLDVDTLAERLQNVDTIVAEYRNPEGRWFQARFIVKSREESGKVREILYVARDFTEEKQYELKQEDALRDALLAAKQANRAKTTFLNNMSHDIRTPMNAIIGFTALAQTHIENRTLVQDYLNKIHTSGTHLLNLINEILDMSRIESGVVKLEEDVVHIPDVLRDLRIMIQGQVEAKRLMLYIDALDVKNEDVVTDKLRLNQILLNIVSNAIKYTGTGGNIIIRVTEKPCARKGYTTYEFSIKDNGMGMTPEFVEHVFDIFSREQSSTVSGIQGTGLGMSITKNIVDMMNGTITVESQLGKGSEFVVTVDFKVAEPSFMSERRAALTRPTGKRPEGESTVKKYDYSGRHVLLVEDNELNREIATAILEEMKMTVDQAADGTEAVSMMNKAEEGTYDLIFMDIQMPKMDGYTATREIRTLQNNKKANIPIIAMTANAFDEDRQKSFEAGMNGHIAKPIDMATIAKFLDKIFT